MGITMVYALPSLHMNTSVVLDACVRDVYLNVVVIFGFNLAFDVCMQLL